jgi:cell division inhibitor SulA
MSTPLQEVLKRADIWQASSHSKQQSSLSTEYFSLDQSLHSSGWPLNQMTELLIERAGIGEMQLVLPALAKMHSKGGWLFLIEPPFNPYAPGWLKANIDIERMMIIKGGKQNECLWAAEKIIANQGVCCSLFWPPHDQLSNKALKRLQLAAEQGCGLNFVFRSLSAINQSSPASLRLLIKNNSKPLISLKNKVEQRLEKNLVVEVLKQRGGWSGQVTNFKLSLEKLQEVVQQELKTNLEVVNNQMVELSSQNKVIRFVTKG